LGVTADGLNIPPALLDALLLRKRLVRVGCRGERDRPHLFGTAYAPRLADKAPRAEQIAPHVQRENRRLFFAGSMRGRLVASLTARFWT
jgi:hypothetical protein